MCHQLKILPITLITLFFTTSLLRAEININSPADTVKFICNELLGRPTDNSISINLCADQDLDTYVEYGTQQSEYNFQTPVTTYINNVPFNIVLNNLLPGSTYFYRVRYRITNTSIFMARDEHSFHTAKRPDQSFTFAIEADPHLDYNTNPELYKRTLQNIQQSNPDFLLDLGDTFMSEKLKTPAQDSVTIRHLLLRSYFDLICHSIPLYLVIGNHEGELGWLLNGTANNIAVMASNTRTKYYPNPIPDAFYSGNTVIEPFVGLRQNYYAWEWGNSLFIVLDPYWYTKLKPNQNVNNWSWTLGKDQYQWFKDVLEKSKAKFKFVFAHQVVGGLSTDGRGGIEAVPFYEMGGNNADNTWGFAAYRPDWEMPIHQLMVKNKVTVFFHGHDHFYGKQELDGIEYQEVPQPGNPNYQTAQNAAAYGYVTGQIIPSSGFLRVTVTDSNVTVDYVRSYLPSAENQQRKNNSIDYSYTVSSNTATAVEKDFEIPEKFSLDQNYPNPFNPETMINYQLPVGSNVSLKIYDVLGREVATLLNGFKPAGSYNSKFSILHSQLSAGIYFYRFTAGSYSKTMKMLCLK